MNLCKTFVLATALAALLLSPACKSKSTDNPNPTNDTQQAVQENDSKTVEQAAADTPQDSPGNAVVQKPTDTVADTHVEAETESAADDVSDSAVPDAGQNNGSSESVIFDDNIHYDDFETCRDPDGCPCGQGRCKDEFKCIHGECILYDRDKDTIGGESERKGFYCKDPNGCICGTTERCPKGSFCLIKNEYWHGSLGDTFAYCGNDDEVLPLSEIDVDFDDTDDTIDYAHILFYEKNSRLEIRNGKRIGAFIVCSQPGCDCNGTPLEEGYYCVKQHLVFDRDDPNVGIVDPSECDSAYVFSDESKECEISDDIIEPVCLTERGCKCGSSVIQKGDICVHGKAHCSTLNPRKGCLCGSQMIDEGYGCLRGQPVCYPHVSYDSEVDEDNTLSCKCHDKDIHRGDICTKDGVICAPNSTTTGCLCGRQALRDGYRCFDKKQICQRDTCQCGETDIQEGDICGDDNKPIVFAKTETKRDESGDTLLKCDDTYLNIADTSVEDARGIFTGVNWLKFPEAIDYLCTCGTYKPIPGKGYGCLVQTTVIGEPPETLYSSYIDGYNCLNLAGCDCGKSKCFPILCMDYSSDRKGCCDSERTLECTDNKYTCGEHRLSCDIVVHGYGCYKADLEDESQKPSQKNGWYCKQDGGCPCGKTTCEQYQKCEAPGKCSTEKLSDSERLDLKSVSIKRTDDCIY